MKFQSHGFVIVPFRPIGVRLLCSCDHVLCNNVENCGTWQLFQLVDMPYCTEMSKQFVNKKIE